MKGDYLPYHACLQLEVIYCLERATVTCLKHMGRNYCWGILSLLR